MSKILFILITTAILAASQSGGDYNKADIFGVYSNGQIDMGLNIRLDDRIDFRVVRGDLDPVRIDGGTQQNFRFGIGLVFG